MANLKYLCVYCGSNPGRLPEYRAAARALAEELVRRDIGLVYGGASVGIMGVIADSVLNAGGSVIGVIPRALADKEVSHRGLTELKIVGSMHERKAVMADLADGFIALPGGLGTLEELFEILTWAQLGFHNKPCALLNTGGYYDGLIHFLEHAVNEQFVKPVHRALLLTATDPAKLLDLAQAYHAPVITRFIERDET